MFLFPSLHLMSYLLTLPNITTVLPPSVGKGLKNTCAVIRKQ